MKNFVLKLKANDSSLLKFIVAVFLFHHSVDASQTQIFSGPVSQAMGGGGRAGAEANELMYLNPATVALVQGFDMGLIYRDGYWAKGQHETSYSIALMENDKENFAPGAFAYVKRRRTTMGQAWDEQMFFGSLAYTASERFVMGLSLYHITQEPQVGAGRTQFNGTIGTLIKVNPTLGFAYVFANPAPADRDIPNSLKLIPQQSLAMNLIIPALMRWTVDITRYEKQNPDKKGIIQTGAELFGGEFALFRFGMEFDDIAKRNSASLGIGFNGPRLKANYAITKPLRETDGAMHSVDLRLPF